MMYVLCVVMAGCFRTHYPIALLDSQRACAEVYRACAAAVQVGKPCGEVPRCPMTAKFTVRYDVWVRDLGVGVPWHWEAP